ncbi:MAG: aldehyde ferredoxin oxidoreductase C-terminal domain-containing protein, partial [Proteobacteria bacterium]|nr:aldehyde ferredoxin oxidoreductase C-terminal domain-containing protein [Pseudomonadota bacterium]
GIYDAPGGKEYPKLFAKIHAMLTETSRMEKYHDLGTAGNVATLNEIKSLPWRNLQQTTDPLVSGITGETFAEETLLRNMACSGCPVGCIHIGYVRERFQEDNRWMYYQVSYDYELIFAVGSMLGVTDSFSALKIMDRVEKEGLDIMSAGVALAWATEALAKGVITKAETMQPLAFGDGPGYERAMERLGAAENDFYRTLAQGLPTTVATYGGGDFACVLGQEMAGYATGEVYFASQALGFRHAHLDSGGYAWDQKHEEQDVVGAVDFLINDGRSRAVLTSMVSCLFARGVYSDELLAEALECVGYSSLAANMEQAGHKIERLRWGNRIATGYDPHAVKIPKRFLEVETWKGKIDPVYLDALKKAYADRIVEVGRPLPEAAGSE